MNGVLSLNLQSVNCVLLIFCQNDEVVITILMTLRRFLTQRIVIFSDHLLDEKEVAIDALIDEKLE
jgi:hypothetical protein